MMGCEMVSQIRPYCWKGIEMFKTPCISLGGLKSMTNHGTFLVLLFLGFAFGMVYFEDISLFFGYCHERLMQSRFEGLS